MHLTDCFVDLMAYVSYFLKSVTQRQPPYSQVKADILRLLGQSEECVRKGLFPREEYDLARFAVCAWVDEAILNSAWKEKAQWQKEQLQRVYYRTTEAGEEFFERLNTVGLQQRGVREVYYLCLALGFMGRHCHPGDEFLLGQLKASNLKLLLGTSVGIPSLEREQLFPDAYPVESFEVGPRERRFGFSIFTVACLAAPVVLFGLLYLIYRFALSGIAENFLRTVTL
ncbi:MAG TPA: DotU family type IV/VI secretion system protein [Candidatus Methylomirabilis sp.]|nr:DotU family type IV/VI secretion system protein [Candidatus Methylomirabilis sp.]